MLAIPKMGQATKQYINKNPMGKEVIKVKKVKDFLPLQNIKYANVNFLCN